MSLHFKRLNIEKNERFFDELVQDTTQTRHIIEPNKETVEVHPPDDKNVADDTSVEPKMDSNIQNRKT